MAITDKEQGVWELDEVYNKINQGGIWDYSSSGVAQRLYVWGKNDSGSLGQNSNTKYSSPVQVPGDTWVDISSSSGPTVHGIKLDGTAWGWGYNFYGDVGINDRTTYSSPKQIPGTTWRSINLCGAGSYSATKTDGTLWVWGGNEKGQLGQNSAGSPGPYDNQRSTSKSSPTQITGTTWDKINSGGSLYGEVAKVGACTKTDGTLWLWGNNENAQLGQGNTTDYSSPVQVTGGGSWQKVVVGEECVMAQKTDGTLWAWGHNEGGVMGLNTPGPGNFKEPQAIGTDTNWKDFDIKYFGKAAFGTKTDGTLWSWGFNDYGSLGQNNDYFTQRSSPTQIGTDTTWASVCGRYYGGMATKTNGTLWIWGSGAYGQLGQNSIRTPYQNGLSSPTQIGSATGWTVESDSAYHNHMFGDGSQVGALSKTSQ